MWRVFVRRELFQTLLQRFVGSSYFFLVQPDFFDQTTMLFLEHGLVVCSPSFLITQSTDKAFVGSTTCNRCRIVDDIVYELKSVQHDVVLAFFEGKHPADAAFIFAVLAVDLRTQLRVKLF